MSIDIMTVGKVRIAMKEYVHDIKPRYDVGVASTPLRIICSLSV